MCRIVDECPRAVGERIHCGRMFTRARPHQRYCKPACRMGAFKAKAERRSLLGLVENELLQEPFE